MTNKGVRYVATAASALVLSSALAACGSAHTAASQQPKNAKAVPTTTSSGPAAASPKAAQKLLKNAFTVHNFSYKGCDAACWHRLSEPPLPASAVAGLKRDCVQALTMLPHAKRVASEQQLETEEQEGFAQITKMYQTFAASAKATVDAVPHPNQIAQGVVRYAAKLAAEYEKGPGAVLSGPAQIDGLVLYTYLYVLHTGCEMTQKPNGWTPPPGT